MLPTSRLDFYLEEKLIEIIFYSFNVKRDETVTVDSKIFENLFSKYKFAQRNISKGRVRCKNVKICIASRAEEIALSTTSTRVLKI